RCAGKSHVERDLSKRTRARPQRGPGYGGGLEAADGQDLSGIDGVAGQTIPGTHLADGHVVQTRDAVQRLARLHAVPDGALAAALRAGPVAGDARGRVGLS